MTVQPHSRGCIVTGRLWWLWSTGGGAGEQQGQSDGVRF